MAFALRQKSWHWYSNTNAEPVAGDSLANQDTIYAEISKRQVLRLRITLSQTGTTGGTRYLGLGYNTDNGTTWTKVGAAAHWNFYNGLGTDESSVSTNLLDDSGTGKGWYIDDGPTGGAFSFGNAGPSPYEFDICIQATENAVANTTYYFNVLSGTGADPSNATTKDTGEASPQTTTSKFLNISKSDTVSPNAESVISQANRHIALVTEPITVSEFIGQYLKRLNISIADTIGTSESITANEVLGPAKIQNITETLSVSETKQALLKQLNISRSDSVLFTESATVKFLSLVDDLVLTWTYDFRPSVSDTVTISESVTPNLVTTAAKIDIPTVSESIDLSESAQALFTLLQSSVSDSITFDEAKTVLVKQLKASVSEPIDISEVVGSLVNLGISVSDAIELAESLNTFFAQLNIAASDAISVSETKAILLKQLKASVSDAIDVAESLSANTSLGTCDTITIQESILALLKQLNIAISESVSFNAEQIQVGNRLSIQTSDSIGISDGYKSYWDIITFSENIFIKMVLNALVSDSLAISETLSVLLKQLRISASDTIGFTENIGQNIQQLNILVSDTVQLSEALSALLNQLNISVSDSINLLEQVAGFQKQINTLVTDNLEISDLVAVQLKRLNILIADAIDFAESVSGSMAKRIEVSAQDDISFSETINRYLSLLQTQASDQIEIEETVAGLLKQLNLSVTDSIDLSEYSETALGGVPSIGANVSDSISFTDDYKFYWDTINFLENVLAGLFYPPLQISVSDAISISESISVLITRLNAYSIDSIEVRESIVAILKQLRPLVSDSISFAEVVSGTIPLKIAVQDDIDYSESASALVRQLYFSASDNIAFDDQAQNFFKQLNVRGQDSVSFEDGEVRYQQNDRRLDILESENIAILERIKVGIPPQIGYAKHAFTMRQKNLKYDIPDKNLIFAMPGQRDFSIPEKTLQFELPEGDGEYVD